MTKSKGYKIIKKWHKLPVYGCNDCDFETMKVHVIENHVALVHRRKIAKRTKVVQEKLDRYGVPVREQITSPMKKEV